MAHDLGKAIYTEEINGVIHAYEHEKKGLPLAETFLRRITAESKLIRYVLNLVELHMKPNTVAEAGSSVKTTTRMFDQAINPEMPAGSKTPGSHPVQYSGQDGTHQIQEGNASGDADGR